jgi:RNA polymerase sigma factor (sigma-70 family)
MIPNTTTSLKEKSFDEVAKQYEKLITKIRNKYTVPNYSKDDIEQEAMMILWNAYQTFDESKGVTFTHYFYKSFKFRIAYLINYNKQDTYLDTEAFDIDRQDMFKSTEDIQRDHKQEELDKELWAFIDKMPNGRTARYYYIGQMNLERIAQIEKISPQAVHDRLKTIHRKLKREYGENIINFIAKP